MPEPGSIYPQYYYPGATGPSQFSPGQREAFGQNLPPYSDLIYPFQNFGDRFYSDYEETPPPAGGLPTPFPVISPTPTPSFMGQTTGSPGSPNDYGPSTTPTDQPIPAAQQLLFGNQPTRDLSNMPAVQVQPPQTPSGQTFGPLPGENWIGGGPAFTDPNTNQLVWNPLGTFNYNSGGRIGDLPGFAAGSSFGGDISYGMPQFSGFGGIEGSTSRTGRAGPDIA